MQLITETMDVEDFARIAHEANRAYCETHGDVSQPSWTDAPLWQRESAIDGVRYLTKHPSAGPESSHDNWLKRKREEGWAYGPVKDEKAKTHPCMVPFDDLPAYQQVKDYLFHGIVHLLTGPDRFRRPAP